MKQPLVRLSEKTANLGNYNLKYLHMISSSIDPFLSALEREGVRDRVHLWSYSVDIPGEMDVVLKSAQSKDEALEMLGCYYSLQFLHMNLRMVDLVKLELATSTERDLTSRKFMLEVGRMFRQLTRSYMHGLLSIFLKDVSYPEFVMLGVGTKSDQDDIDLGIVRRGGENPEGLNRAMGKLSNQMFKTATRLHFHLSEYVGDKSLTATIEEYEEVFDNNSYDFIIVNEMIGAATILGSKTMHEEFRERVTDRFYFDKNNRQNRFHEGFLRGILGEIRSVLSRPLSTYSINPKEDGLRPIRGLLSALKLVHGIDQVNAWDILDELRIRDTWRREQYDDIEKTLSFFELFRHLYQLLVAQDEDIAIREAPIEAMVAKIARMIGFEDKGMVPAEDFMLVLYYRFLEKSVSAIDILTGDLRKHLKDVSVLRPILSGSIHSDPDYKGNLAVDFVKASFFSENITYWEDFLVELDDRSGEFYRKFVRSFSELQKKMRGKVGSLYVSGVRHDPAPVLKFLTILAKRAETDEGKDLFSFLSSLMIEKMGELPDASDSFSMVSVSHPVVLNNFLSNLSWKQLEDFMDVIREKPALPDTAKYHRQLVALTNIHRQSSHFFRRHFHPLLNKYPVFIKSLYNNERLREISNGLYSDLTSLEPLDVLFARIGDYYDMEFVRVSLLVLAGTGSERTDAEFIEFSDRYTQLLYEFAMQDVHMAHGHPVQTHDLLAMYTAGGHAREQGFDDDYDMFFILDSSDAETIALCNRIVAKMNFHILKRGILPHHRFADHFGSYLVSFDQLVDHLSGTNDNVYVDLSQILGSRMLSGTRKLDKKLMKTIIEPLIFEKNREFVDYLYQETMMRHSNTDDSIRSNIKECPGGQRDIEMLLLIYKARHRLRDPLSRKMLENLKELAPEKAEDFDLIIKHMNFIRRLRDIYRLKVAAQDEIEKDSMGAVAESFGMESTPEAANILYDMFIESTDNAYITIRRLMDGVWD
ncbi:MAG: hypothetical protein KAV42_10925 [Candidatus Krumholzibacteria bacterium]|nr:hypothetical protein [Candidatus Krumholzibacteria bacterium]